MGGKVCALVAGLVLMAGSASAHHGSGISYDTASIWTTWATVTEFNYMNPHPTMTFDRKVNGGRDRALDRRAHHEPIDDGAPRVDEESNVGGFAPRDSLEALPRDRARRRLQRGRHEDRG